MSKDAPKDIPKVCLPICILEHVNKREEVYSEQHNKRLDNGWRNKLIQGDNLLVAGALLERLAGKINLIYIDPPFATGRDFYFKACIGESEEVFTRDHLEKESRAYRDTWWSGVKSYIEMMRDRLILLRDLLSPNGCIYVHCDWHANYAFRTLLDEIMGREAFVNEIIWSYKTGGIGSRWFSRKHDTLFLYAKGSSYTFHPQYDKSYLTSGMAKAREGSATAEKYGLHRDEGGTYRMATARDVWDIMAIYRNSPEILGFPTQKPEGLLERVIQASSNPGDIVADFFCGSGTTLAVSEKLGRRWIGCDLGRWAIHVTRKRLLSIPGCKPFDVINLGRHERQYWQGVSFSNNHHGEM